MMNKKKQLKLNTEVNNMKENISVGTVIRTVCLLLALVNLTLETFGKRIIPISDEQVSELITLIFTIVTSVISFWKNNSFTQEAIIADGLMKDMKNSKNNLIKYL